MRRREFTKTTAAGLLGLGLGPALITGTSCAHLAKSRWIFDEFPSGDRNFPINQVFPPDVFYHNGNGGRILDVTKAPFNAKGDGVTDDTKALEKAMRFIRENIEFIDVGGRKSCSFNLMNSWMIYIPDGEYLVSDTVSQGWPAQAFSTPAGDWQDVHRFTVASPADDRGYPYIRNEDNCIIRVIGQSRDKTIIRLKDNSPGYDEGAEKAVLTFYLLQRGSNTNRGNYLENITINTGKGNPGAIGVKWNASNWGGIYNVAIRSGDGTGRAGLMMDRRNAHGYHHDMVIDGFDVGIELVAGIATTVVLEYITLLNQGQTAILVGRGNRDSLSARKIMMKSAPAGLKVGRAGHALLLESEIVSSGVNDHAIIVEENGHLFARDINLSGYSVAVKKSGEDVLKGNFIDEYISDEPVNLRGNMPARSLRLEVRDAPVLLPEQDFSKWASVDDFGAVGDGIADDTEAIQKAMNSGKPVIYFPKANYVVNGTVNIPSAVQEISFLWASVHRSEAKEFDGPAMFRVARPSRQPLLLRQNMNAGGVLLDHEADRTVILKDVVSWWNHARNYARAAGMLLPSPAAQNTEVWHLYRNTRPEGKTKEVFASNVMLFAAGNHDSRYAVENVRAWVRQLNNEHLPWVDTAFRRSEAWILGFKSEFTKVLFRAEDNTKLEVLGGVYGQQHRGNFEAWYKQHMDAPLIISRDSQISMAFYKWPFGEGGTEPPYTTIIHDETNGRVERLPYMQFQKLGGRENEILIPLLVNFSDQ